MKSALETIAMTAGILAGSVASAAVVLRVDVESGSDLQPGFESLSPGDLIEPTDDGFSRALPGGMAIDVDGVGFSNLNVNHRLRTTPATTPALTQGAVYRDFLFAPGQSSSNGLDTTITGLKPRQLYDVTLWSFDTGSTGDRVSDWSVVGGLGPEPVGQYTFDGSAPPTMDGQNTISFSAYADRNGELVIQGRGNPATTGDSAPATFLNGLQVNERTGWELVLAIDVNDRDATGAANTQPGFEEFVITGGTTSIDFGDLTVTLSGAASGVDDRRRGVPTDGGLFTRQELLRDFAFASDFNNNDEGLDMLVEGLTPGQPYEVTLWSFDDGSGGDRTSDWFANGLLVQDDYLFNGNDLSSGNPTPPDNDVYHFDFVVAADALGQILIEGRAAPGVNSPGVFLNAMTVAAVPEPATWILLLAASAALVPAALFRRLTRAKRETAA